MADLSTLTVSLDTAKALKAAGFPQNAVHYWHELSEPWAPTQWVSSGNGEASKVCAAPTLAEVLTELRGRIHHEGLDYDLHVGPSSYGYKATPPQTNWLAVMACADEDDGHLPLTGLHISDSAAEAAALLYLALVSAGHIHPTSANTDA